MRTHIGKKTEIFKICGKGFYYPSSLYGHLKTHEKDKQMAEKGKTVKESRLLQTHEKKTSQKLEKIIKL